MNDSYEDYGQTLEISKEIQKQQQILTNNNLKLENILNKTQNKDVVIKELSHILEIFLNNNSKNFKLEEEFFQKFRKVLLKFRRYEILNSIFLLYELSKNISSEINNSDQQSETDNDQAIFIDLYRFNSKEIHIKPLLNFQNDNLKLKFSVKENLENFTFITDLIDRKEESKNINLSSLLKQKCTEKQNKNNDIKSFNHIQNQKEKSCQNKKLNLNLIYDIIYDLENSHKGIEEEEISENSIDFNKSNVNNIISNQNDILNEDNEKFIKETNQVKNFQKNNSHLIDKHLIEKEISEIKEKMRKIEIEKFEKQCFLNKIIKRVINKCNDKDILNYYEIIFDEAKQILFCKSLSNRLIYKAKSEESFEDIFDLENCVDSEEQKAEKHLDLDKIQNIKKESFIYLENQINKHLKIARRNTKNLKQTYNNFENFIDECKKKNSILNNCILKILPFGSFTQFSFNKKSDLEITIITKFLFDFHENEKEKEKFQAENFYKYSSDENSENQLNYFNNLNHNNILKKLDEDEKKKFLEKENFFKDKFQLIKNELNVFITQLENTIDDSDLYFKVEQQTTSRTYIIRFYDKKTLVKVELMIDNILTLYNSNLIRNYCLFDSRVIILLNFIKDWSKLKKINSNYDGYLSSYCLTMMVIFFLQKINPKILPNLQHNNIDNFENILFYNCGVKKYNYDIIKIRHLYCNFNKNLYKNETEKFNRLSNEININSSSFVNKNSISDEKKEFKDSKILGEKNDFKSVDRKKSSSYNSEKNRQNIKNFKENLISKNEMSIAELIFNFFKFYLFYFDEKHYCIDIQHKDYVFRFRKFANDYESNKEYVIIDPIDFGYNPAKYLEKGSNQSKIFKKELYNAVVNIAECKNIIENENPEL